MSIPITIKHDPAEYRFTIRKVVGRIILFSDGKNTLHILPLSEFLSALSLYLCISVPLPTHLIHPNAAKDPINLSISSDTKYNIMVPDQLFMRNRTVINDEQTDILKRVYMTQPFPNTDIKKKLAQDLGLPYKVITVWFQNRRQNDKRMFQREMKNSMM
ncbi:hypothetical protein JTB14_013095 [Gonioctena quinquepunctata]|nr:hypothetical protein JTB14_013095 [Gonioctena quinquepunctata]